MLRIFDNYPVLLWCFYGVLATVSLMDYMLWVRPAEEADDDVKSVFGAFVFVTLFIFFTIASVSFYWAQSKALNQKERQKRARFGIMSLFFASDTPLFFLNMVLHFRAGFRPRGTTYAASVVRGVDFLLRIASWGGGFLYLWSIYLHIFADTFHARGYNRPPVTAPIRAAPSSETPPWET